MDRSNHRDFEREPYDRERRSYPVVAVGAVARRGRFVKRFVEYLLDVDHFGVLLLDSEFRIVEASRMVCAALDRRREELLGCEAESLFRTLPNPLPVDRALLRGSVFRNRAYTWRSGERRREWMLDGDLLRDGGKAIGASVVFRDVTHLLELEEQVRRSDRLKMIGEVAAGTAHEIRNPLTAIKGFMQLLERALSERRMKHELSYIEIVMNELERVNDLVGEFLLLSKPKKVELLPFRLGRLFGEMLPMLSNEALMHNVSLHYEAKPELPPVYADKEMLKQVFLNLGKNAIEAMDKGGSLIIRERRSPVTGEVIVDICDTGPGIPEERLERIFDPFFTTKEQGTGLGLSICQRIAHEIGGRIDVASGSGGTVFSVAIPALEAEGEELASGGGALPFDDV